MDYLNNKMLFKEEHEIQFSELENLPFYEYEMLIKWYNDYIDRQSEQNGVKEVLKLSKNS